MASKFGGIEIEEQVPRSKFGGVAVQASASKFGGVPVAPTPLPAATSPAGPATAQAVASAPVIPSDQASPVAAAPLPQAQPAAPPSPRFGQPGYNPLLHGGDSKPPLDLRINRALGIKDYRDEGPPTSAQIDDSRKEWWQKPGGQPQAQEQVQPVPQKVSALKQIAQAPADVAKGLARGVEQAGKIPLQIVEMGADLGSNIYGGLKQDWYRAKDMVIKKFAPDYYARKEKEASEKRSEIIGRTGPMISLSDKMEAGRDAINRATQTGWEKADKNLSFKNQPVRYVSQFVSEAIPTYAAAIAGTAITKDPRIAMGLFASQAGGNAYESAKKEGMDVNEAIGYALLQGGWSAISERIPFDSMLGNQGKKAFVRILKAGSTEGIQEVIQTVGENAIEKFGPEEGKKLTEGWIEALIGGVLLGGVGGAVISGGSEYSPSNQEVETNPVLATPERPVLISNQPEVARTEEGVRISAPEELAARVNPLLEPERVAQATAQAERPAEPQAEVPRPADKVAAPEDARPPIEQARDEAGAPRQAPPAEPAPEPTRDSAPLAARYTPEQLAEIKAAQEKRIGEMRGPGEAQGEKPAPRTAADLAKPVAAHAKVAVVEAMRGLAELVKADPAKLGSGPVMFDEKNYAKAKVHFQKAWVEAKAAGNSIKEFSDYVVSQLGDAIRPFLARFVEEVERSEEWGDRVADARTVDPNTGLRVTAPMKAVGDSEREGFGVKPREPVFTREWDDAVISEARSQISSADKIIAESRKGHRAVTDTDIATMLIAKTERINARVEAAQAMKANPDDPAAQKAFTQAQERLTEVYEAIEKAGTTSGRALAAMKMTMDERYGVVENMEWEIRAAKGGKEVTPAERTNLERIQQQYVREKAQYEKQVALAKEQYADLEERLGTLEAQIFYDRDIPRLDPATLEKMAEGGRLYSLGLDPDRVTSIAKWMLGKMAKGIKNPNELALKHLGEEARPTINAARAEAAEMAAKAGKGASKQRTGKPKGKPTPASEIRDLYRAQIEAGVREVNEATRNVTAEWNKTHGADAQMTEKQIRDTFSDYGKVIPLTKDEIKRALSELRREAQLTSSIERAVNGLHPLKTGRQRFPPTSEARGMLKTLNNLLKEKGLNAVDPERQLKSAMDARKSRMRDAIEDKKRAIETLQRLAPNKKPPELDAEGQRLKAELDRITEEYNKVFPKEKTSLTDQERLAIATRAAERSLRDVVKELKAARDGAFVFKKKYPGLPHNEYLAGLRAQKRVAQQEILELKELANPGQMAIKKRMRQIESAIKQYKQKLLTGDFTPRKPMEVDISNNPMAMLEKANLEVLKSQYARMKEDARFAALPIEKKVAEKMVSGVVGGYNFFRNIKSSWDNSGALRQGKMLAYSNPIIWAKSLKDGYKVYFSRDASVSYWEAFKNRPNFDLYKKSGLAIGEGNGRGDFGPIDDLIRPDLAQSMPLVGRHMRQFTVTLNNFRANLFDKLIANASEKLSDEDLKSYASFVNAWTGRGELGVGKYKLKAEGIAQILWAPRFISSSFTNALRPLTLPFEYALYGIKIGPSHIRGLLGKSPAARAELRNVVTTQYLRAIGSLAAIYATGYALNSLFGDDGDENVEKNLTSSDVGNINIPGTDMVINPLNDMKPALVFAARFLAGYQKTRTGERRKLTWWGGKDTVTSNVERTGWAGTWDDFWKTKGHPAIGSMKQVTTYKNFIGDDLYPWFAWATALSPIVPQSYVQMFRTEVGPTLDSIDLTHLPEFAVLAAFAYAGVQPSQRDYKTPRYMKVNLKKEDYEKKRTSAIMAGTSYEIVNGVINSSAAPEARAYLEQFLEEDGADALRAALKAEFSERRKAQKDRAGRIRTDDAESKRRLQLNRLIRAYEKEQKKKEEDKRRRDLERAAQKGQIA